MDEARARRARLRAWRRGIRELDLILGPFADARAATMSDTEMASFERLLDVADHDLYAWIVGSGSTPPAFDDTILTAVRQSALSGGPARGG